MSVLVQGDGGTVVHATVLDNAGEKMDLSSKSVTLAYAIGGGTLQKRAMIILDQNTSKGETVYQLTSTDLDVSGELEAELILNDTEPDKLTTEKFRVTVRDRLA